MVVGMKMTVELEEDQVGLRCCDLKHHPAPVDSRCPPASSLAASQAKRQLASNGQAICTELQLGLRRLFHNYSFRRDHWHQTCSNTIRPVTP